MPQTLVSSPAALKEWAITCAALARGRQIILLRKGGLLDEDGTFQLEHREFFFCPTWLHQETGLVRPEHRDLFDQTSREPDEGPKLAYLRHFARVERVWALGEEHQPRLEAAAHIWSRHYLDLRFGYKPEKPLLCAALRLWELETPVRYGLRPADLGCRSWIEWDALRSAPARPVLDEAGFAARLAQLEELLG